MILFEAKWSAKPTQQNITKYVFGILAVCNYSVGLFCAGKGMCQTSKQKGFIATNMFTYQR